MIKQSLARWVAKASTNENFWSNNLRNQAAQEAMQEEQAKAAEKGAEPGPDDAKEDHHARMQQLKKAGGNSLILSALLILGC